MIVQHLVTDHFGEGLCVYRSEFEKPGDYEGYLEEKVAGPFQTYEEACEVARGLDPDYYCL